MGTAVASPGNGISALTSNKRKDLQFEDRRAYVGKATVSALHMLVNGGTVRTRTCQSVNEWKSPLFLREKSGAAAGILHGVTVKRHDMLP